MLDIDSDEPLTVDELRRLRMLIHEDQDHKAVTRWLRSHRVNFFGGVSAMVLLLAFRDEVAEVLMMVFNAKGGGR